MTDKPSPMSEDFRVVASNPLSTVEDYKQFYLKYPNSTIEQYAKQFTAQAELWYDGNVMLAVLSEMCYHLGGWSGGMQEHGKQVQELLELAKKDRGHGEEWQGDCDCKDDK